VKTPLSALTAVLLTGAAAGLIAAGDDKADANPATLPAPAWIKMIHQGDNDPLLKGYMTPVGVKVEIFAVDPQVFYPVAMTFADDGTPYVLESAPDRISHEELAFHYKDGSTRTGLTMSKTIRDPIGTLDVSKGSGDAFHIVLEDDLPSGLLVHDGWLYVGGHGTVRRYKQSKDQGPYDIKEVVAQGFGGLRGACGLAVGPDGWLYISAADGDNIVEGSDGSRATALGVGAIFRCRPDGSKMQTYATGFIDPRGPASFDPAGNLFHKDNCSDDRQGPFTKGRVMFVAEGADFGWRKSEGEFSLADPVRAGDGPGKLPPMLWTSKDSSGGMVFYGDARFPESYRGLLFAPELAEHAVRAYKVGRKGATFEIKEAFDLFKSDDRAFRPQQVVLGPDSAVYVVDEREEKHGRIYRLTWAGTKDQPALPPRPMDSWARIAKLADDDLVKALQNEDVSDREHAARELAKRGEKERPALLKLLKDFDAPDPGRIAALGALESMWDGEVQAAMMSVLGRDSNRDLRRLAADALGLNATKGDSDVHAALLRALNDTAPEVRRSAALAMSRVAADGAPDNLVNTWAFDDGRDAYLSDGLVRAIEDLGKPGVDLLIALGESGVQKDWDKMVQAFTMMRTRPAADAIPRALDNPHLTAAQRAALIHSYANYLLDPPVSLAPAVDYLIAHPKEDPAVKQAGLDLLALSGTAPGDKAASWALGFLDDKDPKLQTAAVKALETLGVNSEEARRIGQAYLDKKLPPDAQSAVVGILLRHEGKDADCKRLLEAVRKTGE
jgi:putative membrane-bound dehydrogenase-like protein